MKICKYQRGGFAWIAAEGYAWSIYCLMQMAEVAKADFPELDYDDIVVRVRAAPGRVRMPLLSLGLQDAAKIPEDYVHLSPESQLVDYL